MSSNYYVYEHWRLDKDECFYVGKGKGKRAYAVSGRNQHWKNIVSKLEREGFAWEVRIVSSGLSENESYQLEIERINFWSNKVDLSNKTGGGVGHSNPSKENIEKLRFGKIGKPLFDTQTLKNNAIKLWSNEEYRSKQLEERKNRYTDEFREKLKLSHLGHKDTEETKIKKRLSAKIGWEKRRAKLACR